MHVSLSKSRRISKGCGPGAWQAKERMAAKQLVNPRNPSIRRLCAYSHTWKDGWCILLLLMMMIIIFLVTIYESCSFWLRAHFEHLLFQAKKVKVKLTVEDAKVRAHTVKEMKHIEKVLHERNLSWNTQKWNKSKHIARKWELVKDLLAICKCREAFFEEHGIKVAIPEGKAGNAHRDFVNTSDINLCSPGCGHHPVGGLSIWWLCKATHQVSTDSPATASNDVQISWTIDLM